MPGSLTDLMTPRRVDSGYRVSSHHGAPNPSTTVNRPPNQVSDGMTAGSAKEDLHELPTSEELRVRKRCQ